jgi:inhibitor of KinA
MSIEPLGDQAVLITCRDEDEAATLARAARADRPPWLIDVVLAYQSLALYYDSLKVSYLDAAAWGQRLQASIPEGAGGAWPLRRRRLGSAKAAPAGAQVIRMHEIPCCYELGPDLQAAADWLKLDPQEVIQLHAHRPYRVFAIGFSPGFPYLGYLADSVAGLPRLETPRLRVEPGSVGITGRQTCVYPSPTPGGWRLIGRTPRLLVDLDSEYFPLRVGDFVRFVPISKDQFDLQRGLRLDPPIDAATEKMRQSSAGTA